jgi:hypothetical protein
VVFNATFNNISVILWHSVLLVEETGEPWENHRPVTRLSLTSLDSNYSEISVSSSDSRMTMESDV